MLIFVLICSRKSDNRDFLGVDSIDISALIMQDFHYFSAFNILSVTLMAQNEL